MFTNNYIKYRKMMFASQTGISFAGFDGAITTGYAQQSYNGDIGVSIIYARCEKLSSATAESSASTITASSVKKGVWFGRGATPPTADDYALEDVITSGLSIVNGSTFTISNPSEGKYIIQASYTVTNTTEEEIIIREIGLFGGVAFYGNSSNNRACPVLFERQVLDEPITIPAGAAKVITYKITVNQTSA